MPTCYINWLVLPVRGARQARQARRHHAARGSRAGTDPARVRGPTTARRVDAHTRHQQAARTGPTARSETIRPTLLERTQHK